jgi:hypothetical protein
MLNAKLSKLLFAGLLFGAGAVQAAAPSSVSEVPAAWYADEIRILEGARGAAHPVYPAAAYEHGSYGDQYVDTGRPRIEPSVAGRTIPFPSSPNESGSVL